MIRLWNENLLKVVSEIGKQKNYLQISSVATLGLSRGSVSNEETPAFLKICDWGLQKIEIYCRTNFSRICKK